VGRLSNGGRILVVGECLVDMAPSPPRISPAGDVAEPTGPPASEQPRTPWALDEGPVAPCDGLERGATALRQPRQHFVAMPGGGPANVALGLARLGVPTAFAGRFSRFGFGPWLRDHLAANDLDLTFSVDAEEAATLAVVTLDGDGRASYTFYGPGTADWQWKDAELPGLIGPGGGQAVAALHTGSLATTLEPGASVLGSWMASLHDGGRALISFDPNVRPGLVGDVPYYRERLTGFISSSHLVKASNEDLEVLYPGGTARQVADKWLSLGPSLVVITEGREGAMAVHQSGAYARCAPPEVEVADTIGAGDAFTSGLLAYFAEHDILSPAGLAQMSPAWLQAALDQAVAAGAFTCTRPGADPPTRAELADFVLRTSGS
jgi:fructokinase